MTGGTSIWGNLHLSGWRYVWCFFRCIQLWHTATALIWWSEEQSWGPPWFVKNSTIRLQNHTNSPRRHFIRRIWLYDKQHLQCWRTRSSLKNDRIMENKVGRHCQLGVIMDIPNTFCGSYILSVTDFAAAGSCLTCVFIQVSMKVMQWPSVAQD